MANQLATAATHGGVISRAINNGKRFTKRGGNTDNLACKVAASRGGYYGPFLP